MPLNTRAMAQSLGLGSTGDPSLLARHTNAPCDRRALAWELFAHGVEFPVPDDVSLGAWGFQGRMSMQPHSLDHPKPAGTERRRQRNTCITAF